MAPFLFVSLCIWWRWLGGEREMDRHRQVSRNHKNITNYLDHRQTQSHAIMLHRYMFVRFNATNFNFALFLNKGTGCLLLVFNIIHVNYIALLASS